MGLKSIPQNYSKKNQKLNQSKVVIICHFFLNSIFNVLQDHFWHPFWNPILAPDSPKKQQDEPKRAIRSFKYQKTAFSKTLKNRQFFNIFGSRDLPREPQETQEDSQEATKELQNLKKNYK